MSTESTTTTEPAHDTAGDHGDHDGAHAHPSEWVYIKVALILAVLTAIEVGIYYVPSLEGIEAPVLIILSTFKFVLVVLWFMHLRFDNKLFRRLFFTGIILAVFCFVAVLSTFHVFTR